MIAVKLGLPQISTMSDLPIRMDYFSFLALNQFNHILNGIIMTCE